jgi:hypothetical protein
MRNWLCVCSIITLILGVSAHGLVGAASKFHVQCPLRKGDPVTKVKEFYGIAFAPKKLDKPWPSGTAFLYHFREYGVWVFFDSNLRIQSLRFDAPFGGKIGGIAIGDTKDQVRRVKGEPMRRFDGTLDAEALATRKRRKLDILDGLPDPAPKEQVLRAFKEIAGLDASPIPRATAWVFNPGSPSFVRYDFGSLSGRVQTIFANCGTVECSRLRARRGIPRGIPGTLYVIPGQEERLTCSWNVPRLRPSQDPVLRTESTGLEIVGTKKKPVREGDFLPRFEPAWADRSKAVDEIRMRP